MNLQRQCKKCGDYFPVKPLELRFFCERNECTPRWYISPEFLLEQIKKTRFIAMNYFDIYDLDRPIHYPRSIDYERVCRICGNPLINKKGEYSYHKRYCNEHNGDELWTKYNWGIVSNNFAHELQELQESKMLNLLDNIPEKLHDLIVLCEACGKLCLIHSYYYCLTNKEKMDIINIHHKIPVHTLNWDNLHLIWDYDNLIALCPECHNNQDHQLKKINRVESVKNQFQKITNFI